MTQDSIPPVWRKPPGVADGTWQYVHQRSIARHYDAFVADTPLCQLDLRYVLDVLQPFLNEKPRRDSKNPETCFGLVLDLGAGTGRLSRPIRDQGWDVLAVDLSQNMLQELVQNDANHPPTDQAGTVLPLRANLVQLESLRDSIADHAICMFSTIGMIQGRAHRVQFLKHIARIVRPGGCLIVHAHRRWAALHEPGGYKRLMHSALATLRDRDAEFGDATYAYRGLEKMFMHRFTSRSLQTQLQEAGWTTNRSDFVGRDGADLVSSAWNASGMIVVAQHSSAT